MLANLFKYWTYQVFSPGAVLREKYDAFKSLLEHDQSAHEGMAELQRICYDALPVDANRIIACYNHFSRAVGGIVDNLAQMCPGCYSDLKGYHTKFDHYIRHLLIPPESGHVPQKPYTLSLSQATEQDSDQVGGKAQTLIKVINRLPLPVPPGFVITTNAFWYLIEHNQLRGTIQKALARIHPDDPSILLSVSKELTAAMLAIAFPPDLKAAIDKALNQLAGSCPGDLHLAVRSSAVAEDSDTTFAGQYRSCLQVSPADLRQAYRQVLASRFDPTALYYRIRSGLADSQTPMAVLVMEMIAPRFSGVLYSRGPTPEKSDTVSIHYVSGLGEALVSGQRQARVASIPRSRVSYQFHSPPPAFPGTGSAPYSLDSETTATLAQWALQLENLLQTPCDVEWCQDMSGQLSLLQCRPLKQQLPPSQTTVRLPEPAATKAVLFEGGLCACAGIGSGPVHVVAGASDLSQVPDNCVAVLTNAPPHYVPLLDRVNAVVIETGSVAGHFQAVAREFSIPTLVNVENAARLFKADQPVTVDAGSGRVYEGYTADAALVNQRPGPQTQDNPILRTLTAAMSFIAPLELTDPHAPTFTPPSCRSMHDIIRFAHEKAVFEMFAIGDRRLKRKKGARQLLGDLPMVIYLLDVGGGVHAGEAYRSRVNIEHVSCEPMQALWQGLLHADIEWAGHHHFDWAEYDRLVMNGGIISPDSALLSSYAVVADRYLNFCLKFGYHFAIIDALFQEPPKTGHIWFRFSGGGGESQGRQLRIRFLDRILTALGFSVKTEGELIHARRNSVDNPTIAEGLTRIGHLLGVTRLMDMHLKDETTVDRLVESFLNERFKDFNWEAESDESS